MIRGATPVSTRNATFQGWRSLLTNRAKRRARGEFLVQGVRPISMAVDRGWTVRALLHDGRGSPSAWALRLWGSVPADRFVVDPALMQELGEKDDPPELVALVEMPGDDLARVPTVALPVVTVFDRPSSPGNIGALVRSIDALGGSALLVTGHAADPYDPRSVRASTGSLFSVPVVRAESQRQIFDWVDDQRRGGVEFAVVGADERAGPGIWEVDLVRPLVVVIGNEATGLSAAWRDRCDLSLRIPITGAASSLNAATAGSIILYEAMRQRAGRSLTV